MVAEWKIPECTICRKSEPRAFTSRWPPENRAVGLIDSNINRDLQRIVVIERQTGNIKTITPQGLYIYEYDWSPDSHEFTYTAALPPGDDNWYIAKLFKQPMDAMDTTVLYKPTFQIAVPRWSPDGKRIAFIEGLMSDQGGTGGDMFTIAATGNEKPRNLTPNPNFFTQLVYVAQRRFPFIY